MATKKTGTGKYNKKKGVNILADMLAGNDADKAAARAAKLAANAVKNADRVQAKADKVKKAELRKETARLKKEGASAKTDLKLQFLQDVAERLDQIADLQELIKKHRATRAIALDDMRKNRDRIEDLRKEIKAIYAKAKEGGIKLSAAKARKAARR